MYFPVDSGGGAPWGAASRSLSEDQERRPNGLGFRLRRVTWKKHPPLCFKEQPRVPAPGWARLRRVPSLRSCSVGPRRTDIHVLTALSPHPCGSAHCAKPAFCLHPSRDWRCLDFLRMKIKIKGRINGFPAKAGPTVGAHPAGCMRFLSRTGFSREEVSQGADSFADRTPPFGRELARECCCCAS